MAYFKPCGFLTNPFKSQREYRSYTTRYIEYKKNASVPIMGGAFFYIK